MAVRIGLQVTQVLIIFSILSAFIQTKRAFELKSIEDRKAGETFTGMTVYENVQEYSNVKLNRDIIQPSCIRLIIEETLSKETGYPIETHEIETEDHYLLTYHRVPRGRNGDRGGNRKPLLFVSGIFMCSYLHLTEDAQLPFLFADQGYDVWLANYRGNYYSRKHKFLDPDNSKQYWNYTLTELGKYDLPAAIDYILKKTGQPQLTYVGASMGTTMFWMLGATRPEYMSKVTLMVAIAPVARPAHIKAVSGSIRYLIVTSYLKILEIFQIYEVKLFNEKYRRMFSNICDISKRVHLICKMVLSIVRREVAGIYLEPFIKLLHSPASSVSLYTIQHYLQIGRAKRFMKFDYGSSRNLLIYGKKTPLQLSLKKITVPIFYANSKRDDIATLKDVRWLENQLPSKPTRIINNLDDFTHIDFFLHHNIRDAWVGPLALFLKNRS